MNGREVALQVLAKFENSNARIEELIGNNKNFDQLGIRERKFAWHLVMGAVRHLSNLDWKARALYKGRYEKAREALRNSLRLGIYEMDNLDHIPPYATINEYVNLAKRLTSKSEGAVVNGVLRTYQRERGKFNPRKKFKFVETQLSVAYSFPEWMIKRWLEMLGADETEKLAAAMNERPLFELRVNRLKSTVEEFTGLLDAKNIKYQPSKRFEVLLQVEDTSSVAQSGYFQNGFCSVQDESAFLVAGLVAPQPGETILDACAAPGGKATAMAEMQPEAKFIAADIDARRVQTIVENIKRLGTANVETKTGDATILPYREEFDKVLIDAPCSGLGTIQKNPDIKWRRTEEDVEEFHYLQLNILSACVGYLKPGGLLVYSTCTIDRRENEDVISEFLAEFGSEFEVEPPVEKYRPFLTEGGFIRTFPHRHGMDGSFAALLRRKSRS